MTVQIQLPGVSLDLDDVLKWGKAVSAKLHLMKTPWAAISPDQMSEALSRAVFFLLADRLSDGIGRGGWGLSDKVYMADLYGPETGGQTQDSVMTTVAVVKALHAYCDFLRGHAETRAEGTAMWAALNDDLTPYLQARWDPVLGCGGTLARGRENDWCIRPSCRHTAWLLDLWLVLPGYQTRVAKTIEYLLAATERIDWRSEKVATPVAVHSSLHRLQGFPQLLETKTREAMQVRMGLAEDQIVAKYVDRISGWTSGLSEENGRQTYTWFVLAEMAHIWGATGSLASCMKESLAASLKPPWSVPTAKGITRIQGEPMHLAISALASSALARLPKATKQQAARREELIQSVVEILTKKDADALVGTYSWALAYFVMDAARELGKPNA